MGRLLHFFTRDDGVAPERHSTADSEPPSTAVSAAVPAPLSTPSPTPGSTADSEPLATAPIYVIRDAGIVIDLAYDPVGAPHPARHAVDLLHHLMRDEDFAGQLAAEKAIKKYYVALCRTKGTKTFPWLSVARPLNRVLRLVYGPTYQKTYKRIYEGSRLRKRRVYRVPLLAEFNQAAEALEQEQDVAKVA